MFSFIAPMKATPGELPRSDASAWAYEVKWDGMRAIVQIEGGKHRIWSSNEIDATSRFPELEGIINSTGASSLTLDGEIVALDERGVPSFQLLQSRIHVDRKVDPVKRARQAPATLVVFDLLQVDGNDLLGLPWSARRQALEQLVDASPHWQVASVATDGEALLAAVTERKLEGIVAKRRDSVYQPGRRSALWRKIKVRTHDEFVVGGWTEGERSRSGTIGALLIGYYDESGSLHYAGRVGSGLSESSTRELAAIFALESTNRNPFEVAEIPPADARRAHWVKPSVVVEVAYAEITRDGKPRHPSYIGRRIDKAARDVGPPSPTP